MRMLSSQRTPVLSLSLSLSQVFLTLFLSLYANAVISKKDLLEYWHARHLSILKVFLGITIWNTEFSDWNVRVSYYY